MPRKKGKGPFQDFKADENTLIESGIDKNVFTQHSTRSAAVSRVKKQKNKKQLNKYYKLGVGGITTLPRTYKTFTIYACSFIMLHKRNANI